MSEELHKIQSLQNFLYFKKKPMRKQEKDILSPRDENVLPKEWPKEERVYLEKNPPIKTQSPFVRFFIGSLCFFGAIVLFVGYTQVTKNISQESSQVFISIEGPSQIRGGETYPFVLRIENATKGRIENARAFIEYHTDSQAVDKKVESIYSEVGIMEPLSIKSIPFSFALYGEQGSTQSFSVTLEYTVQGATKETLLTKKISYPFVISSTPIGFRITAPEVSISGQEITIDMTVINQSNDTLKTILAKIDTPPGFLLKKTDPDTGGSSLWDVGSLLSGAEKTLRISGFIEGSDTEEKTFRFSAGKAKEGTGVEKGLTTLTLDPVYNSLLRTVKIIPSPLKVDIFFDEKKSDAFVFETQKKIQGRVSFENNTNKTFSSLVLSANFETDQFIFDIESDNGTYDPIKKILSWNTKDQSPEPIIPGTKGSFPFTLIVKNTNSFNTFKTGIDIAVGISVETPEATEDLGVLARTEAHVMSNVQLVVEKKNITIKNSSIPPKVGKKSSYTVSWAIVNSHGQIRDMRVRTVLPQNVMLASELKNASLVYTPTTHELVWNVGTVEPFSGQKDVPKKISFTVEIMPTLDQRDTTPVLVQDIEISGFDISVGREIRIKRQGLTTRSGVAPGSEAEAVVRE